MYASAGGESDTDDGNTRTTREVYVCQCVYWHTQENKLQEKRISSRLSTKQYSSIYTIPLLPPLGVGFGPSSRIKKDGESPHHPYFYKVLPSPRWFLSGKSGNYIIFKFFLSLLYLSFSFKIIHILHWQKKKKFTLLSDNYVTRQRQSRHKHKHAYCLRLSGGDSKLFPLTQYWFLLLKSRGKGPI